MKKIPKTFRKNGFDYTLLKRNKNVVLLEQFKDFGEEGVVRQYEVHKVRLKPSRTAKYKQSDGSFKVVKRPEREELASDSEFGTYGWHFRNLSNAMKKFKELVKNER